MPEELRNSFGNNPRNVGINKIINQKQITMTKEQELRIVSFGYGPGHSDWEYLATELPVEEFNKSARGTYYVAVDPGKWPYPTEGFEDDSEVKMLESGLNPVLNLNTYEWDTGLGADWIYKKYGDVYGEDDGAIPDEYWNAWYQACRDQITRDHITYAQIALEHVDGPLDGELE